MKFFDLGEVQDIEKRTSGSWLNAFILGFTFQVLITGYTASVINSLMMRAVAEAELDLVEAEVEKPVGDLVMARASPEAKAKQKKIHNSSLRTAYIVQNRPKRKKWTDKIGSNTRSSPLFFLNDRPIDRSRHKKKSVNR